MQLTENNKYTKLKKPFYTEDGKYVKLKNNAYLTENGKFVKLKIGGASVWVSVGGAGNMYSLDGGVTWTKGGTSGNSDYQKRSIATNGKIVVSTKSSVSSSTANMISYTKDGITWTEVANSASNCYPSTYTTRPNNVSYIPELNKFFITRQPTESGMMTILYQSNDGINWSVFERPRICAGECLSPVVYDSVNKIFFAIGKYSGSSYNSVVGIADDQFATTTSMTDWYNLIGGNSSIHVMPGIATHNGLTISFYLNISSSCYYRIYSTNGKTWTTDSTHASYLSTAPLAMTYANGKYILLESKGAHYSVNGSTWTKMTGDTISPHYITAPSITYDGEKYIIGNVDGKIFSSSDGTSWSLLSTLSGTLNCVSYLD